MPGELSTAGANIALDAATGRATQTARTMYLALLTAAPTDSTTVATMTEYAATGYSRVACAMGAPTGDPATTANTGVLTFGPLTGANGSTAITHCALVSSASGTSGDLVAYWTLTASRTPAAGDSVSVAIGALTLSND
jgi:hypothetical protein